MTHAVIDIETFGLKPGCIVRSVGVQVFDPVMCGSVGYLLDSFYAVIGDGAFYGLTSDPETEAWWDNQDDAAKQAFINPRPMLEVFTELSEFYKNNYISRLWTRGPHFDISILDAAFNAVGIDTPWKYNQPRDVRTALDMAGIEPTYMDGMIPHHALHDATNDAINIQRAYTKLGV